MENDVSGDVTMTTAGTFYDGPTVTLTAGTWYLVGAVHVSDASANADYTAKLWDGTTVESSGQVRCNTGQGASIALGGIVTVTTSTAWKISVTSTDNGSLIKAATVSSGAGNNASFLRAIRIG